MPELPTLTITAADGTVRDTLTGIRAEKDRHVTDRSRAQIVVDAARWQTVAGSINRRADRFRIDAGGETGWFGGRFRDTERGGQQVTVILDDYERDARDAEPTGGQVLFQNVDDATVVQDAISRIPTLSAGTIETVATGLSFSFSNAEPAKMIRDAAQPGGALVRYNADRTVDFVARPATGSEPELSTAANTLVGDPDVSDDNRNPPTEIIGLGAQSGPNQVRATATVDATAAREVYRRYENKDIQQQNRLQTTVDRLADEVAAAEDKLDVEAGAINLDVRPGDPVSFVWPARGIDETVRVIEFTEVVGQRGQRYAPLRVSNRWPEQGGADKAVADLERFNSGYQGFIDRDTDSYGWQPVNSTVNATRPYPYPDDVLREDVAEVLIESIPYRSFVGVGGHTHDFSISDSSTSGPNSQPGVKNNEGTDIFNSSPLTISPSGWTRIGEIPAGVSDFANNTESVKLFVNGFIDETPPSGVETLLIRLNPTGLNINYPGDDGLEIATTLSSNNDRFSGFVEAPIDLIGEQAIIEAQTAFSDADFVVSGGFWARGEHSHTVNVSDSATTQSEAGVEPGINEFPNETASNVNLQVNGSFVEVDIGTGEFSATVDISGELTAGINTIEVGSDSLGLINITVNTQLFRQGGP